MIRRLSILTFLLLFGGNSISGTSPHFDGEGGCSMECCKAAHENGDQSLGPKLCCKVECKRPAGTQDSSSTSLASATRSGSPPRALNGSLGVVHYLNQTRFPDSPTRHISGSCRRFLETGTLLI